ncbi:protein NSP-INTERACTING KINASE 3 [Hordeum vulgare]|nr:protein NSP-INTERACTING KINASE 3 [Hordeum vulgare]
MSTATRVLARSAVPGHLLRSAAATANSAVTTAALLQHCRRLGCLRAAPGYVSALGLPSQRLSGKLSPDIGNLTRLQSVLLQNNAISGTIPSTIGRLGMLQTLDMSDNHLTGSIPTSLGDLKNLNYLWDFFPRLSISLPSCFIIQQLTPCPLVAAILIIGLLHRDLSFNNLSGLVPKISARTFRLLLLMLSFLLSFIAGCLYNIAGNSMICGVKSGDNCSSVSLDPLSYPPDDFKIQPQQAMPRSHRIAIICGATVGSVAFVAIVVGMLLWWRHKHNQQIFFDVNGNALFDVVLDHINTASISELFINLSSAGAILQEPGLLHFFRLILHLLYAIFTIATHMLVLPMQVMEFILFIYKSIMLLQERVIKYLMNSKMCSLMSDKHINRKPALDWSRRKMIALGTARGLLYLHEQCDPKIIHRDVKASNVLLDEYFETIVGDFRLAKLLDHQETHVTTAVRGTVGHIAPEYLSTGQSSEKTDVFGFGVLLVELITGQKALDFGRLANQKGGVLDLSSVYGLCIGTIIVSRSCMWWFNVKKLHQEKQLNMMVDKDLGSNYDRVELEEMVQVALMCTRYYPSHRPRMSEVIRMLEGDGLAEK